MTDWLEHVAIRRSAVGLISLAISYNKMISSMRGRVLICQLPRLAILLSRLNNGWGNVPVLSVPS